ncbi:MAG: hypothetical protein M1840_001503 [Geoglossum simile]|nr:MAG: hypothetical protein M1840_001503 [Geoglossum simile]
MTTKKRKGSDADAGCPAKRPSARLERKIHRKRKEILCEKCTKIAPAKNETSDDARRNSNGKRILLSRPAKEIVEDALGGCQGCIFLCRFLAKVLKLDSIACLDAKIHDEVFRNHLELKQCSWAKLELRASGLFAETLSLEACEVSDSFVINDRQTCSTLEGIAEKSCRTSGSNFWDDDGELGRVPRPVCLSPVSPETLAIISLWLRMCSTHARCRLIEDEALPTRVLDVSSPGRPRLRNAQGMRGQYVILSHCWGPANGVYKTTKERLVNHQKGFRHECLPQNFRDAILFTERLGFRYLWIDALCIVQDDPDDWTHETSLMETYYNRSALMLSASAALHCESGFLRERRTLYSPPFGVDQWFCLRSPPYQVHEIEGFPISQRAWTMQERYLAPRVLHFLPDHLLFECGTSTYSEGYFKNNMRESDFFTKARI